MNASPAASRQFVPADLDVADWSQVEPLFAALHERKLDDVESLEAFLRDFSELTAVVAEFGSRRMIEHSCHTDDPELEKAYLHVVQQLQPKMQPWGDKLHRRLLDSPALPELLEQQPKLKMLEREWRSDVELFREANVPIFADLKTLASEYDKLIGAMLVTYNGKEQTLQQLARYQQETDRGVREETWRLTADRRLVDREAIESIFEKQLDHRAALAKNAGKADYRDYAWQDRGRFDYTPADCEAFHEAVERVVVPRLRELDEERRELLQLDTLRPWDGGVDPRGRSPLHPFPADDTEKLRKDTREALERVSGELAEMFDTLEPGKNLDLDSRPGKRAGGYQSALLESGEPFIFMNAAGLQRDVETLLHEAGHAFHFQWAFESEPLVFLQHAPLEFCEVASMGMELIALPHYDVFYESEEDADRARRAQLEGVLRVLPWIATIDAFQHWLYTNEGHSREDRKNAWLATLDRFSTGVTDWSDLDAPREAMWHRQLHLFHHPFYYIEYGIAQLGSLGLWQRYRDHPQAAMDDYKAALSLGDTRPLPELFEAAGLPFDFSRGRVEPLVEDVAAELDRLPA